MSHFENIEGSESRSVLLTETSNPRKKPKGRIRKIVRSLHRDIGYFCIGMTVVFAISGIAVNHIDDWNPNYEVTRQNKSINISSDLKESKQLNSVLLEQLGLDLKVRTEFWESENRFKLFTEADTTIEVDFENQMAVIESVRQRPILSAFNRLHLNEANRAWVIFSDLFAVLLLFLAFSSFFMLKGKNGVFSLKGLWVVAGVIVPAVFIVI